MFEIYVPTRLYFGLGALDQIHTMQLPGKHALVLISQGKSVVKAGYWDRTETTTGRDRSKGIVVFRYSGQSDDGLRYGGGRYGPSRTLRFCHWVWRRLTDGCRKGRGHYGNESRSGLGLLSERNGKETGFFQRSFTYCLYFHYCRDGERADSSGMINNIETKEKFGIGGPSCFPVISVVDPALTLTVPQRQMVYQGLDALFHCVEGLPVEEGKSFQ